MRASVAFARGIGAALILVACAPSAPASSAGTVTAGASPSASVATTDIASRTATFTSPLMGYTVTYPLEWVPTPATKPWTRDARNLWDDPVGDHMESATAGFRGTSQPLAPTETPEQWLRDYFGSSPACREPEQVQIGDHTGTIGLNGCPGLGRLGGKVFDAAVVVGGRGYNFTAEGEVDHALFLAILKSVRFTPERAVDPPAASPS